MAPTSLYIGSDHAGFALKAQVKEMLQKEFPAFKLTDCGCHSTESCDYPTFGKEVGVQVVKNNALGILMCGSGVGISIAANKVKGARAALCHDVTSARMSRLHNNANIVCFGARFTGVEVVFDIVRTFLKTEFEGGRHEKRVQLLHAIEGE